MPVLGRGTLVHVLAALSLLQVSTHAIRSATDRCEAFWCWDRATQVGGVDVTRNRVTHRETSREEVRFCRRHDLADSNRSLKWMLSVWGGVVLLYYGAVRFTGAGSPPPAPSIPRPISKRPAMKPEPPLLPAHARGDGFRIAVRHEPEREDGPWAFYFINGTDLPIDSLVLDQVGYEWGDFGNTQAVGQDLGSLGARRFVLAWLDTSDAAEVRVDLRFRVRIADRAATVVFEVPKLYRRSGTPPGEDAPLLGKAHFCGRPEE